MIRCSVVGASGFAGAELVRWLSQHPDVMLRSLHASRSAGEQWERLYPEHQHLWQDKIQGFDEETLKGSDVVFLAQPHEASVRSAAQLLGKVGHIIDLSGGLRLKDPHAYEEWYGHPHPEPDILGSAVYGIPELFGEDLPGAKLVACGGCYATAAQLATAPAVNIPGIHKDQITLSGLSGTSGAGRKADIALSFTMVSGNLKAYRVGHHQHVPEIQNSLASLSGVRPRLTFVPHLIPIERGILLNAVLCHDGKLDQEKALSYFQDFYANAPFVRVLDPNKSLPEVNAVRGSNFCDIAPVVDKAGQSLVIVAAIDNLGKGAASQAVQVMNLVCGMPETRGLLYEPKLLLASGQV